MVKILQQSLFSTAGELTGGGNPVAGLGWVRGPATHPNFSTRTSRWVTDGDRLETTQERTPGISAASGSQGHDLTGFAFTPQIASTNLPLFHASAASIYGGNVPTTFEIEIAMTVHIPAVWPTNGNAPLNGYFATGLHFFHVHTSNTDWDPIYQLYFIRTPANDQELRGEWMLNQWNDIDPDTVPLTVTGQAGAWHIYGAAGSQAKRGNLTAMQLKVVFHSTPSGNTNEFGMRIYSDQELIFAHGFGRNFLISQGCIIPGQQAVEALRRRMGFFAYANGETTSNELDEDQRPAIDAFIIRDLLADAEPPLFPEPALSSSSVLSTASLAGEGTASAVLTLTPSFADSVQHSMSVAAHPYETGHEATFPQGAKNRRQWTLAWEALTTTQRDTLRTFVDTVEAQSQPFTWIHPTTSETIKARFSSEVGFVHIGPDQYRATATAEELF